MLLLTTATSRHDRQKRWRCGNVMAAEFGLDDRMVYEGKECIVQA